MIDRSDGIINLCEMKFLNTEFQIDKRTDTALLKKRSVFQSETKTKKSLHTTIVTTYGLLENAYSGNVPSVVVMEDLFAPDRTPRLPR
ncbi:MAG: hypothetical protein LBR77_11180 [Lachnospiraceae bacterium]|nr:hypothetical protein [Lachnospiraceae bacterium]